MTVPAVSHTRLADMPLAVEQFGFEELGGILYVACGRAADSLSASVYAYNPATNTWAQKTDYPIAVQSLVLKAVGGKLYGIGGHNSATADFYGNVYEFDPAANDGDGSWTAKTAMPTAREDFGAAVYDGKIYCFGGLTNVPADYTPTAVMEVYDPATDSWDETLADLPDFKHFGDFAVTYDSKIYAIGGSNTFDSYPAVQGSHVVYVYNPALDSWATVAEFPYPTSYKEVVALGTVLYVVAGVTINTANYTNTVFAYDPVGDSWEQKYPAPYAAGGTGLAVYNGAIYMCGGAQQLTGTKVEYLYRLGYA